jgi:ferredoxin
MDMCVRKNVYVIFISNITIDTEILDKFLNKYKRNICGWLINSDYPDSQRELFLRNFKLFVDKEIEFSISTTLTPNNIQNMKSADRISELLNIIGEHKTDIRISPMTPNHIEYSFYDYSMDVLLFLQKIWNVKMCEVNFDCTINCCEFSKDVLEFFRKTPQISFKTSMCDGCGAFDVLVDGSVVYCSSTKDIIRLDNIFDYNSIDEARKVMNDKWVEYWINNPLACNYSSCGNFNPAYCMGVCPAKNSLWKEKLDGCAKAKA